MQTKVIDFNGYNARKVFVAVVTTLEDCGEFRSIKANGNTFRVTASHGLPIFGEDIEIRVVATSTNSTHVEVRSSDKLFFNVFKWGNNTRNCGDLADFIQNNVYRLLSPEQLGVNQHPLGDTSTIRIAKPNIRFK